MLENLRLWRFGPKQIRMDNGPEFISQRSKNWAKEKQIKLPHFQPGKPVQNACIERFNRTFREDVFFDGLDEIRETADHWLETHEVLHTGPVALPVCCSKCLTFSTSPKLLH